MRLLRPAVLLLTATLLLVLSACGGVLEQAARNLPSQPAEPVATTSTSDATAKPLTLADDGIGVCIELAVDHLGTKTKVNEIDSGFSVGKEIEPQLVDPENTPPAGQLTRCIVTYQNPDDPKKLVQNSLDTATSKFGPPRDVEITVMGDSAQFDLNEYLIPISKINTAPLAKLMKQRGKQLDQAYAKHGWSGVSLASPDTWSARHRLQLGVAGRLKSNDLLEHGTLEISVNGKKVLDDQLAP